MWSHTRGTVADARASANPVREKLLVARLHMMEALHLLDLHSRSAAAPSLDMALHLLDRELSAD